MVKRLLPLIVALAVAGAPVALEACDAACAWATPATAIADATSVSTVTAAGHPCHGNGAVDDAQSSHALNACGHRIGDQLPASTAADGRATGAAVPVAVVAFANIALGTPRVAQTFSPGLAWRSLLPGRFAAAIPLRI